MKNAPEYSNNRSNYSIQDACRPNDTLGKKRGRKTEIPKDKGQKTRESQKLKRD